MIRRSWPLAIVHKQEGGGGHLTVNLMAQDPTDLEAPYWVGRTEHGAPLAVKVSREEYDACQVGDVVTFDLAQEPTPEESPAAAEGVIWREPSPETWGSNARDPEMPDRWRVVFVFLGSDEYHRLTREGWEPFGAAPSRAGDHFVYLRRMGAL